MMIINSLYICYLKKVYKSSNQMNKEFNLFKMLTISRIKAFWISIVFMMTANQNILFLKTTDRPPMLNLLV